MTREAHTHGLWARTAPPAPATAPLAGEAVADVAIVGAGYTGLSAALHLAERGVSAVVLEAAGIGEGGAGRNVGLVNAGMWVMPEALIAVLGREAGNRLIDFLGEGPAHVWDIIRRHGIACEASPVGTLHAGHGPAGLAELRERARQWRARGAPVALLDGTEAAAMLGSDAYAGALLDRRAGTIQPLAYVRGLARAAIACGGVVHTGSPAVGLAPAGNGWRVATPGGAVRAGRVLLAGDVHARHLHEEIARQQVILPYFNMATAPLPEAVARTVLPGRHGVWDTRAVLRSFRLDAGNRLIFGSVGALRNTGTVIHRRWAERALRRTFPQLGPVAFEHAWYGRIGMTADHLPRFHRLDGGVYAVCGYNGRGIAPGTVFGRALAGLLAGDLDEAAVPLPLSVPRPAGLRALRSALLEAGAQAAHLVEERG